MEELVQSAALDRLDDVIVWGWTRSKMKSHGLLHPQAQLFQTAQTKGKGSSNTSLLARSSFFPHKVLLLGRWSQGEFREFRKLDVPLVGHSAAHIHMPQKWQPLHLIGGFKTDSCCDVEGSVDLFTLAEDTCNICLGPIHWPWQVRIRTSEPAVAVHFTSTVSSQAHATMQRKEEGYIKMTRHL